jgi:hypothetical protein
VNASLGAGPGEASAGDIPCQPRPPYREPISGRGILTGISAQLRWRQYDSRQLDVGEAYFNPARYRNWDAGQATRKRYAGWLWSGTLGAGREEIDGGVRNATRLAELRAEGALFDDVRLVIHASCNRSAHFATANGYW